MPELSILLPSLRQEEVLKRVEEFKQTNSDVDYEIVLVSPFSVNDKTVYHVNETERRGVLYAMNEAYKAAHGNYIVLWSDDAIPEKNCLKNILLFTKKNEADAPFLAGFSKQDSRSKNAGQWSVYEKLYVGWLCASKKTIDRVGGLFDPAFRNYWGDPDLSLRVWNSGGNIAICSDAFINVSQLNDDVKSSNLNTSFVKDTNIFQEKWKSIYGNGRIEPWWKINSEIPVTLTDKIKKWIRNHIPFSKTAVDHLRKIKSF